MRKAILSMFLVSGLMFTGCGDENEVTTNDSDYDVDKNGYCYQPVELSIFEIGKTCVPCSEVPQETIELAKAEGIQPQF